ncbi:MAG: CpsD/CapB family tyrosine-protein kinase, partial [Pseudomonadota bacterium]
AKTTTSINMGRMFVRMGMSCVLVDVDQRRGTLATTLKLPRSPDLVDVLDGSASVEDALHQDHATDLSVITTRLDASDPAGVLLTDKLPSLVEELRGRFDVVILDTAPLLPVADALPATRLADQIVMMVPYGSAADDIVTGRRTLDRAGSPPTVAVMSFAPADAILSYY